MRARLVSIGFLLVAATAALFWPVVLTYTFLWGERATAQVTRCTDPGGRASLICVGTWRGETGSTGSGKIFGLNEDDAGRAVPVRIGPMGPYGGGFGHSWPLFGPVLPVLLGPPLALVLIRRVHRQGKALAAELLAEPAPFGDLLLVTAKEASSPDGRPFASARGTEAPPSYRPMQLPGRIPSQVPVSDLDVMAGLGPNKTTFWEACGPDGRPMFVVEHRGRGDHEPEHVLMDPAGTPHVIIRRLSASPPSYTLLRPDGSPLGSIVPHERAKLSAYIAKDQQGRQLAALTARRGGWVMRMEPQAPPPFPYVVLAFTFGRSRHPRD